MDKVGYVLRKLGVITRVGSHDKIRLLHPVTILYFPIVIVIGGIQKLWSDIVHFFYTIEAATTMEIVIISAVWASRLCILRKKLA